MQHQLANHNTRFAIPKAIRLFLNLNKQEYISELNWFEFCGFSPYFLLHDNQSGTFNYIEFNSFMVFLITDFVVYNLHTSDTAVIMFDTYWLQPLQVLAKFSNY